MWRPARLESAVIYFAEGPRGDEIGRGLSPEDSEAHGQVLTASDRTYVSPEKTQKR